MANPKELQEAADAIRDVRRLPAVQRHQELEDLLRRAEEWARREYRRVSEQNGGRKRTKADPRVTRFVELWNLGPWVFSNSQKNPTGTRPKDESFREEGLRPCVDRTILRAPQADSHLGRRARRQRSTQADYCQPPKDTAPGRCGEGNYRTPVSFNSPWMKR